MKDKLGAVLFCLLFATIFGGVGVFATWVIATTIHDGLAARDWVRVKAKVESIEGNEVRYRYTFQEREYSGSRLGASPLGASDTIDDWSEDLQDRLGAAKAGGHPITVLVDPQKPSGSMVDAEIRWSFLLFLVPFSLGFGGVGAGALYALTRVLRGKSAKRRPRGSGSISADSRSGIIGLWVFAFFWNVISFPVALLVIPQMIHDGEWLGFLIVIFPLVGLFIAWAAIRGTWTYLRSGGATLKLRGDPARIGTNLEGSVDFAKGVKPGDAYRVNLLCRRISAQGGDAGVSTRWTHHVDAKATPRPDGARIAFRFEVPAHLPASTEASDEEKEIFQWRLEVNAARQALPVPYGFDLQMRPAPVESPATVFADDEVPATLGPGFEGVEKLLGMDAADMSRQQRAVLARMTPEQKAALKKFAALAPLMKKAAVVVACLVAAIILIPFLITLFTNS